MNSHHSNDKYNRNTEACRGRPACLPGYSVDTEQNKNTEIQGAHAGAPLHFPATNNRLPRRLFAYRVIAPHIRQSNKKTPPNNEFKAEKLISVSKTKQKETKIMCGIVGVFNLKTDSTLLRKQVLEQAKKLRHRGPNWAGYILW
ncbi:MAG: hypothetical protein ACK5MG_05765 [Bacteroidales bacterium]